MEAYRHRDPVDYRDSVDVSAERQPSLEEEAESSLRRMIRENPALRQYVQRGGIDSASSTISGLRRRLAGGRPGWSDELRRDLEKAAKRKPGKTVFAVYRDFPLIFQTFDGELVGFAPVLSCTINAVGDLRKSRKNPQIVTSSNGLLQYVFKLPGTNPLIAYGKWMKPQDYIALAASSFRNETFRFRVQDNQLLKY